MKKIGLVIQLFVGGFLSSRAQDSTVNRLADLYVKQLFFLSPETGTFYGISNANNSDLSDNSIIGIKKWQRVEEKILRDLQNVNTKKLTKAGAVTYGILHEQLKDDVACEVCKSEYWGINQVGGWQIEFTELATIQPTGNESKRQATIDRWSKMPLYIKNEIDKLVVGLSNGYSVPKGNVSLVIKELNDMIKDTAEQSPYYAPALTDTNRQFDDQLKAIIVSGINPALVQYRDYLVKEYFPRARTTIGLTNLPSGDICYKALLRSYTTLEIAPGDVYKMGLQAIKDREQKLIELGNKVYGTNDLIKIRGMIKHDTTNNFHSRDEILQYSKAAIARAQTKIPEYFKLQPKAPITITVMPVFEELSGSAHYEPAPDDSTRPGTYFINLYKPENQNKGTAEVTAFHETYPGHHLQLTIARELNVTSALSKYIFNSGYAEGWARYCETLADEMGLYSSDINRLILYSTMPTGMVVDPGIHFKGWTREYAIEYTMAHQPGESRQYVENYVDRIVSMPAQMTTYGIGEIQFKTLRKLAETRFGKKFEVKEFHDKCLEQGSITLNMLSEHIHEWVK